MGVLCLVRHQALHDKIEPPHSHVQVCVLAHEPEHLPVWSLDGISLCHHDPLVGISAFFFQICIFVPVPQRLLDLVEVIYSVPLDMCRS